MCNRHYNKKTMFLVLAAAIVLASIWATPKAYLALNKAKMAKSQVNYSQNYYPQGSGYIDYTVSPRR